MMPRFTRKCSVRSSTVIILVMYFTVVGYVLFDAWFYATYYTFLPMDATTIVAACFVVETVSLARLRIAKESGKPMPAKVENPFAATLGAAVPDFEPEVQETLNEQQPNTKEVS